MNMLKLTATEETVLDNLLTATPKVVARKLGIDIKTVNTYKSRVRKKRAGAKSFLGKTNCYKRILYHKRKGE